MTIRVIRSTELDGITPKNSDAEEVVAETGVSQRIGLILAYPENVEELLDANRMVLAHPSEEYYVHTSRPMAVDVTEDNEIKVTTRNTIYFLKDEGEM